MEANQTIGEEQSLGNAVRSWKPEARIERIEALTPDASLRRYFRIRFCEGSSSAIGSVVAMVFDSLACPEAGGGSAVSSDAAYVSLSQFFSDHGIAVPRLYHEAKRPRMLLIEDLGDTDLAKVALGGVYLDSGQSVASFYRQAIDEILRIQSIAPVPGYFPFERSFTGEVYMREMSELIDFVLIPSQVSEGRLSEVRQAFLHLSAEIEGSPRVLVHRDFHSWNLFVHEGRVRVIDFQDALLGPGCYDVVGLLNDRDTDLFLGPCLYKELLEYFFEKSGAVEDLRAQYDLVLLQRDIKVAGRFAKLVRQRNLPRYGQWIPGTLSRIGRTLARLCGTGRGGKSYERLLEILVEEVRDVAEGAARTSADHDEVKA